MTAKTDAYQIGVSVTPANNFTLVTDAAGGFKIARGNPGATTQDILVVDANGRIQTLGVASAFSAYVVGTQSIPNSAFTTVSFPTELYDLNNDFASSGWTPPAGRPVLMEASISWNDGISTNSAIVSIFKNGVEFKRGSRLDNAPSTPTLTVALTDVPNGSDIYTVRAFQTTGSAKLLGGVDAALMRFTGVRL